MEEQSPMLCPKNDCRYCQCIPGPIDRTTLDPISNLDFELVHNQSSELSLSQDYTSDTMNPCIYWWLPHQECSLAIPRMPLVYTPPYHWPHHWYGCSLWQTRPQESSFWKNVQQGTLLQEHSTILTTLFTIYLSISSRIDLWATFCCRYNFCYKMLRQLFWSFVRPYQQYNIFRIMFCT